MALELQGCCEDDIHSLGQHCTLDQVSARGGMVIPRYKGGIRNGLPINPTAPDTIGGEIEKMAKHTSTTETEAWVLPEPTLITSAVSDPTTATDAAGYDRMTGGGQITTTTITWEGEHATDYLAGKLEKMFKCSELDYFPFDEAGAISGLRKPADIDRLYGYQVLQSTVKIVERPAVKGTSLRGLDLVFQTLKVKRGQYMRSLITASVLGYDANDLEPLKHAYGMLDVVNATTLTVTLAMDSAEANHRLYLNGLTGAPEVWKVKNLTDNTEETLIAADIVFTPVANPTNANQPIYTLTITAVTANDNLQLVITGVDGFETIVSNIVEAA